MSTIYLVGCGKAKRTEPVPAQHLYTGALFQKSLTFALAARSRAWDVAMADHGSIREGDDIPRVRILSALHGLVHPGDITEPYDLALTSMPHAERLAWGERVAHQLDGMLADEVADARIVALAGSPYVGALQYGLAQLTGTVVRIEEPLKGLGIGQRLAWLNRALTNDAAEAALTTAA